MVGTVIYVDNLVIVRNGIIYNINRILTLNRDHFPYLLTILGRNSCQFGSLQSIYIYVTLPAKNSLMLEVHKAGFHREGHIYIQPLPNTETVCIHIPRLVFSPCFSHVFF